MLVEGSCDERYPDWSVETEQINPDRAQNISDDKVFEWLEIQEKYQKMQEELSLLFSWKRAEELKLAIERGSLPYLLPKA